jgi:hypothetical protein
MINNTAETIETVETVKTVETVETVETVINEEQKKEIINKIMNYRNIALGFINTNKKDLISIYLQHTQGKNEIDTDDITKQDITENENEKDIIEKDKTGVLAINLTEIDIKHNVDVAFIPTRILPIELVNKINEAQKAHSQLIDNTLLANTNIMYCLLITPFEEKLIEIDIQAMMQ